MPSIYYERWKEKNPNYHKNHYKKNRTSVLEKTMEWKKTENGLKDNKKQCARYYKENRDSITQKRLELRNNDPVHFMLLRVKTRAKQKGLDFNLTKEDIFIPDVCPVLGIKLEAKSGKGCFSGNSASLDRIDNTKGYVKGNVIVVSYRANSLKKDGTLQELRKIVDFYGALINTTKEIH